MQRGGGQAHDRAAGRLVLALALALAPAPAPVRAPAQALTLFLSSVTPQRRFDPNFARIKRALDNGEVWKPTVNKLCTPNPSPSPSSNLCPLPKPNSHPHPHPHPHPSPNPSLAPGGRAYSHQALQPRSRTVTDRMPLEPRVGRTLVPTIGRYPRTDTPADTPIHRPIFRRAE